MCSFYNLFYTLVWQCSSQKQCSVKRGRGRRYTIVPLSFKEHWEDSVCKWEPDWRRTAGREKQAASTNWHQLKKAKWERCPPPLSHIAEFSPQRGERWMRLRWHHPLLSGGSFRTAEMSIIASAGLMLVSWGGKWLWNRAGYCLVSHAVSHLSQCLPLKYMF